MQLLHRKQIGQRESIGIECLLTISFLDEQKKKKIDEHFLFEIG